MFKNFLKVSIRNFFRNSTYSIINIGGLALAISCALVLFLYVNHHYSYNKDFPEAENTFRLYHINHEYEAGKLNVGTPYPLVPEIRQKNYPEIEQIVFLDANFSNPLFYVKNQRSEEDQFKIEEWGVYTDSVYFQVFPQKFLYGNADDPFPQLYSIVISEKVATILFGKTDVVGESININKETEVTITGVIENPAENSDLQMQFLINTEKEGGIIRSKDWGWNSTATNMQNFLVDPYGFTLLRHVKYPDQGL